MALELLSRELVTFTSYIIILRICFIHYLLCFQLNSITKLVYSFNFSVFLSEKSFVIHCTRRTRCGIWIMQLYYLISSSIICAIESQNLLHERLGHLSLSICAWSHYILSISLFTSISSFLWTRYSKINRHVGLLIDDSLMDPNSKLLIRGFVWWLREI